MLHFGIAASGLLTLCAAAVVSATDTPPLHVLLSVGVASSTRAVQMLAVGEQLLARGHKVTFSAYAQNLGWADAYPAIQKHSLGDSSLANHTNNADMLSFVRTDTKQDQGSLRPTMLSALFQQYEAQFRLLEQYLLNHPVDLVLCDSAQMACMDLAIMLKKPYVISTTHLDMIPKFRSSLLPTSIRGLGGSLLHAPFWTRVWDTLISPLQDMWSMWHVFKEFHQMLDRVGVKSYSMMRSLKDNVIILVSSFPGIEMPRDLPPTVIYTSMPLSNNYPPLDKDLKVFLDQRKHVALVAFGSLAVIAPAHFKQLVQQLATAYEEGVIDGVVWGLMSTGKTVLPDTVAVKSVRHGKVEEHRLADMRNGQHPFIRVMDKVPQRAVLHHPSVKMFLSHGGLGSMHEAIAAAVPLLMMPIFGDQPANARFVVRHGAGLRVDWHGLDGQDGGVRDALARLRDGDTFRHHIRRLGRLANAQQRHLAYAADMVELAATDPDAISSLLVPTERGVSRWYIYRFDVWSLVAAVVLTLAFGGYRGACVLYRRFSEHRQLAHKVKTH